MIPRLSTPVTAVVLAVATFLMCAHRLQGAPMYLSPDEVIIAVDAHSIASTARDVEGHFLPLYFNIQMRGEDRRGWFTPAIFYLSALCQKVLPFSESTVRMPSVLVGTIDVVLMFLVARRLFHSEWLAVAATALLAMTPAHFMLTRLGLDYLYPLPFILAWLLCLTHFSESRSTTLFASTLFLGLGFFSYIASVVMMPLYLLLTGVLLFLGNRPPRFYAAALAGFCLPLLLLLVPWLARHPTAMTDTMQRYDLYDAQKLNALQGIRAFSVIRTLTGSRRFTGPTSVRASCSCPAEVRRCSRRERPVFFCFPSPCSCRSASTRSSRREGTPSVSSSCWAS